MDELTSEMSRPRHVATWFSLDAHRHSVLYAHLGGASRLPLLYGASKRTIVLNASNARNDPVLDKLRGDQVAKDNREERSVQLQEVAIAANRREQHWWKFEVVWNWIALV